MEGAVAILRHRASENAEVEERGINLRLGGCRLMKLDVRATAAEEVTAVRAGWVDGVLWIQDLCYRKTATVIMGLVKSYQRRTGRGKTAAVDRRRPMACDVSADKDMGRVSRIDCDRTDRTTGGNCARERGRVGRARRVLRGAAAHGRPIGSAVGRLEEAHAGLRIGGAIRLTRSYIDRIRVARIKHDRTDRV